MLVDVYVGLSDKAKEIAPQIESLLNGMSYKDAKVLLLAVIRQIRATSVVSA